jgi:trigger factor
MSLERWLQSQGKTLDEYRNEVRQEAERTLKLRFILEAIAEREGITVTDEEVQQMVQGEEVDEERLASLRRQLLEQRVMELVLTTAQWEEADEEGKRA